MKDISSLVDDFYKRLQESSEDLGSGIIESITDFFNLAVGGAHTSRATSLLDDMVKEASKWVGVHELLGSPGKGVNAFRKAVDDSAVGEPWCCAFIQYCARSVGLRNGTESTLYPTELCLTMWQKTPQEYRIQRPIPGSIIVWNYPGTIRGHTGIVVGVDKKGYVNTIEGNTATPGWANDRGVNRKVRAIEGSESMTVLGFLVPFT